VPSVRRVGLALVVLFALLAGQPPAGAQFPIPGLSSAGAAPDAASADAESHGSSGVAPAPAPYPLASLSTSLLESRQALRSAERTLRRPRHMDEWRGEIERLMEASRGLAGSERALPADQRTFRSLFSAANEWRIMRLQTEVAAEAIQRRLAALQALEAQLTLLRERWSLTRVALAEAAPEGVPHDAIDQLAASIEVVGGRTRSELEFALGLQSALTELQLVVDEGTAWVEETSRAERRRLLEIDSPPLWTALAGRTEGPPVVGFGPWRASLWLLADRARSPRRIELSVAVLAALYLLLSAARRGLAGFPPPDRLSAVGLELLRRPVRAAILCVLPLQLLLFPRAPAVFYDLLSIAGIAAIGSLGGPIFAPSLRPYLAGLLGLLLAERLRTLVLAPSLGSRLLLLLIGLLAFAGLAWGTRPGRPARSALAGRWWDAVIVLAFAAAALFGAAVVSNVVGNLTLAELLTSSTLGAGLSAVFLYLMVALAAILLRWVVGRPDPGLRSVKSHGQALARGGTRLLVALAVAAWAILTLHTFSVAQALSGWIGDALSHRFVLGALNVSLGDVAAFLLGLLAAVLFARAVSFLLAEELLPRTAIPRGRATAIVTIVRYLLLAAGFLVAVAISGFELNRLTLLVSAFGIGVGFGLQNIISNFVAGLILILERPIEVGDVVELKQMTGTVQRIGIRSSLVRTFDGASVIVPNGNLISDQVVNWTHSDKLRRIEIRVGAAYGTAPERVLELLRGAAAGHPRVLAHPPPNPLFVGFGDSALDFSLRFWTADFDNWMTVQSDVLAAVEAALRAAGLEIPFPQRDLHLRSIDPAARQALRDAPQPPPAP
jgi:small-conductance mechanosensitive channel